MSVNNNNESEWIEFQRPLPRLNFEEEIVDDDASITASIGSFVVDMEDIEQDESVFEEIKDQWQNSNPSVPTDIEMESPSETTTNSQVSVDSIEKEHPLDDLFNAKQLRNGNNKINRFILTFFPDKAEPKYLSPCYYFKNPKSMFDLWVAQFEECPTTEKLHVHAYVECNRKNRPTFKYIHTHMRAFWSRVQIQLAKRSSQKQRQCAINYVTDARKRLPDTEFHKWSENKFDVNFCEKTAAERSPKKDSKSSKDEQQEAQRLWIESKPRHWTWDQIVHENEESKKLLFGCTAGEKYHKGRHAEDPRRTITNVIIFYGAGGTGKTTEAQGWGAEEEPVQECRYYRRNPDDGAFWGGGRTCYKGQRILHYEEFSGQEAFSRLKEVCDIGKQGPAVNVKNGGAILNHDTVIFTSNLHPAAWFHKLWDQDPKQWYPFERRITEVRFYPSHRPDGSLNAPDSENPPYFVDQTQDFRNFGGDYDQVKEHAATHWPLKEVTEAQPMVMVPGRTNNSVPVAPVFEYARTGIDPTR